MIFSTWWKLSASVSKGSQMRDQRPGVLQLQNISPCDEETCHLFGFTEKNGGSSSLYRRTAATPFASVSRHAGLPWTRTPAPTVRRAGAHGGRVQAAGGPWSSHGHDDQELVVQTCQVQVDVSGQHSHHGLFAFFLTPYRPFAVCRLFSDSSHFIPYVSNVFLLAFGLPKL